MKIDVKINENEIEKKINEAINAKVASLVWNVRDSVIKKLIEKFTPTELESFKSESNEAFKIAVKKEVEKLVAEHHIYVKEKGQRYPHTKKELKDLVIDALKEIQKENKDDD